MAAFSSPLQDVSTFLSDYWHRNSVFRTVQFASAMLSGLLEKSHPITAGKLRTLSAGISNMRIMLRLADDLPALAHASNTWYPNKSQSWIMRWSDIVGAISDQLYYPLEHVAWAADNNLVAVDSSRLWTAAIAFWGLSLIISCMKACVTYFKISKQLSFVMNQKGVETASARNGEDGSGVGGERARKMVTFEDERSGSRAKVRVLARQRLFAVLTVVQNLSDLLNAIHWMPDGFLWGRKFSLLWVGVFGTVSSLIGLYKNVIQIHI